MKKPAKKPAPNLGKGAMPPMNLAMPQMKGKKAKGKKGKGC